MATKCTVWDILTAAAKYDGSPTAHDDVVKTLIAKGHSVKITDAWCTETIMAILYDAGAIDLIGGYAQTSGTLKKNAQKKGIWHSGSKGILPGDIVIFGRNGVSNHTELAVGSDLDISGNYTVNRKNGCSRRKRTSHSSSILGYVRPKYTPMPEMDNLQLAICATDAILDVYGTGKERENQLLAFGKKNAEKIQAEIDRVWNSTDDTVFIMAAAAVAGMLGNDDYRRKRLGIWAEKVQDKIDEIYALRGRSTKEAAGFVIDGKFGANSVRRLFLKFCGYNPEDVQKQVNELLKPVPVYEKKQEGSVVFLFRGMSRKTKDVDGLQGDCWICKSDGYALIGDTMRSGAYEKIVDEVKGCKEVCLYFSHEHSDHMSSNGNKLVKAGIIKRCYVQGADTVDKASKYQSRYKQLIKDCKANGVEVIELRQGSKFDVGPSIHGEVLFQQTTGKDSINMHSLCTLFVVAGETYLTCGDHHCGEKESKFKAPGHVKIYKGSHHMLFTGDGEEWMKEISPEWIVGPGWQSWPNATVGQDPKTKRAQKAYQEVGNLLPGDVCGRVELSISDGMITAKGERNMIGKAVRYSIGGKTYTKIVHVCDKVKFHAVSSMVPQGAKII